MKIKATLIGIGAALALTVGLAGLSGTASAEPKQPSPSPSVAPADQRPKVKSTAGPKEPVVIKPAYTG
ncbi:hypothetical protein [Nonomuraea sediminis]|uniref:hypothetical protein n=1 Tax=Nonomuraea sediminis TaxID=2835864 RepID=UPI001BDBB9C3|nr:hypothetical protein [Nonomuraea sediminis]